MSHFHTPSRIARTLQARHQDARPLQAHRPRLQFYTAAYQHGRHSSYSHSIVEASALVLCITSIARTLEINSVCHSVNISCYDAPSLQSTFMLDFRNIFIELPLYCRISFNPSSVLSNEKSLVYTRHISHCTRFARCGPVSASST
jgi:hypothetical protein